MLETHSPPTPIAGRHWLLHRRNGQRQRLPELGPLPFAAPSPPVAHTFAAFHRRTRPIPLFPAAMTEHHGQTFPHTWTCLAGVPVLAAVARGLRRPSPRATIVFAEGRTAILLPEAAASAKDWHHLGGERIEHQELHPCQAHFGLRGDRPPVTSDVLHCLGEMQNSATDGGWRHACWVRDSCCRNA
jgi:hypothetical protein